MAKKTTTAKKRVVKVEAVGEAHISSTSSFLSQTTLARLSAGHQQENAVSADPRRTLPMLPRWLLRMLPRPRLTQVSAR